MSSIDEINKILKIKNIKYDKELVLKSKKLTI